MVVGVTLAKWKLPRRWWYLRRDDQDRETGQGKARGHRCRQQAEAGELEWVEFYQLKHFKIVQVLIKSENSHHAILSPDSRRGVERSCCSALLSFPLPWLQNIEDANFPDPTVHQAMVLFLP